MAEARALRRRNNMYDYVVPFQMYQWNTPNIHRYPTCHASAKAILIWGYLSMNPRTTDSHHGNQWLTSNREPTVLQRTTCYCVRRYRCRSLQFSTLRKFQISSRPPTTLGMKSRTSLILVEISTTPTTLTKRRQIGRSPAPEKLGSKRNRTAPNFV